MPGTTSSAAAIFASKPRPTQTPARTSQRVRPSCSARTVAHSAPDAAQDQQRVGVVVARDRDRDRRRGEREPGDEAGRAPPQTAREVVDERDRRDAHQRLRHEQAQRVEAEHLHERHLHPRAERRLVDRHRAGGVEGAVEEGVPARAHRAHGGAVVLVGPAVLGQPPEVEDAGDEQEQGQLGPHPAERAPPRRRRGGRRGSRSGGRGAFEEGGRVHGPQLRPAAVSRSRRPWEQAESALSRAPSRMPPAYAAARRRARQPRQRQRAEQQAEVAQRDVAVAADDQQVDDDAAEPAGDEQAAEARRDRHGQPGGDLDRRRRCASRRPRCRG